MSKRKRIQRTRKHRRKYKAAIAGGPNKGKKHNRVSGRSGQIRTKRLQSRRGNSK